MIPPMQFKDCAPCSTWGHCASVCPNKVAGILGAGADRIGARPGVSGFDPQIAALIDHTLLRPEATETDILSLCDEAARYGFASVCVNPYWVRTCARRLRSTRVRIATVIGFPFGSTTAEAKGFETKMARADGADEFDMVINIGALKSRHDDAVRRDIEAVVRAAGPNTVVKVILETGYLTDEEKVRGCLLAVEASAHFVKTSTGYGPGGATVEDVMLMRRTVGPRVGVKASGGIRDMDAAMKMIQAGASRIGTSASVRIVTGARAAAGAAY